MKPYVDYYGELMFQIISTKGPNLPYFSPASGGRTEDLRFGVGNSRE